MIDKTNNELWCNFLVNTFYNHRFSTIRACTYQFFKKHKVRFTQEDYKAMTHFPNQWDHSMTVFGYLMAYYPYVTNKLEALDEYDLVKRLELIKMLQKYKKRPKPVNKMAREKRERNRAMREANAEQIAHNLVSDQRKANGSAVWSQCK